MSTHIHKLFTQIFVPCTQIPMPTSHRLSIKTMYNVLKIISFTQGGLSFWRQREDPWLIFYCWLILWMWCFSSYILLVLDNLSIIRQASWKIKLIERHVEIQALSHNITPSRYWGSHNFFSKYFFNLFLTFFCTKLKTIQNYISKFSWTYEFWNEKATVLTNTIFAFQHGSTPLRQVVLETRRTKLRSISRPGFAKPGSLSSMPRPPSSCLTAVMVNMLLHLAHPKNLQSWGPHLS